MAELGRTKLEAVQDMMREAGYGIPSSIPGSPNGSDEGNAEAVLDQVTQECLIDGYKGNIRKGVALTAADVGGGVFKITLDATILDAKCVAPGRYEERLVPRGGFLYNVNEATDDFGSAVTVYCDVHDEVAWADLAPDLKEVVLTKARERFVRNYRFDPNKESKLQAEADRADFMASRPNDTMGSHKNERFVNFDGGRSTPQ